MTQPFDYHRGTKHHFHQFAPSPGQMEWDTQPVPFRLFEGAPVTELPFLASDPEHSADCLFTGEDVRACDITLANIAGLLELSLGLSCWKAVQGSRWALRMNPSSGNLHPTESYLLLPKLDELDSGVYHYAPYIHSLEQRLPLTGMQAGHGFFLGFTTIFWRESWKYGERAFRYCNLDLGHALAAVRFAANLFGWQMKICAVTDDQIDTLLGLERTQWHEHEAEHPDLLCWIGRGTPSVNPEQTITSEAATQPLQGVPNKLSPDHRVWEQITEVAKATMLSKQRTTPVWQSTQWQNPKSSQTGAAIIRQRRSAVDTDRAKSTLGGKQFRELLNALLPRHQEAPFDISLAESSIHLVFFVHNIDDFQPGIYIQIRNTNHLQEIKEAFTQDFLWEKVDQAASLYLLQKGTFRKEASLFSCGQEICGNGAVAVAMLGRFREEIDNEPCRYRELFWEAGMIGQILYLQAEMSGQRGTGIGCYFDDPVHEFLGIKDDAYQDLYHFTIGYPIVDKRISSHPPYYHLQTKGKSGQSSRPSSEGRLLR